MSEIFQRLIDLSLKRHLPMQVFIGQVESVDIETQTCTVIREDAPKLFGVRLNATIAEYTDRLILKPKKDSMVLLGIIENDVNEAYLLACSELEEISLNIENQSLLINKEGFVFNEGELGGLIKIEELRTQLDKLTARVNAIFDGFSKLILDPPQKGSVSVTNGLKAITSPSTEDFSNIEDEKVKH
ncbi:hypothetical protein L3073_17575 [Ancylomarina sp. DW003]|nr:hypothetical protein [Ancylomarina sp. DW003]MDE5424029.1 hypothetical protein [Ancylomarina sp. DW003]